MRPSRSTIVTRRLPQSMRPARSRSRTAWLMRRPVHAEHLSQQILGQRHGIAVMAVAHHQEPARQPLFEAVRSVAPGRHHHLLQEGVHVRKHEAAKGRHRIHGPREGRPSHPCRGSRHLHQQARRGGLGAEHRLKPGAAFAADRGHLDDAAVGVDRHHRDYPAVWKIDVVERAVRVDEDLLAVALDKLEVGKELFEVARRQSEQQPVAGPIRSDVHSL